MRCNGLRISAIRLTMCVGLSLLSGCYSMNGYVMNASGKSYYDQGNYAAAAAEFQNAVASDPANPDYLANLARTRYKMGDAAGAEQLYRQALTMAPSHQPSYHGMSELLLASGRGDQAAQLLTSWSATQPYIPESHVELAWLQNEMGDKQASAESLQRALQVNPNHATALAHLGQHYQEQGQPGQAVALYQQALQANWNQPEVHSRLASAAEAAGTSSPMATTAMARGVHPQSIPRQQMAFGPPQPAMQFAQRPMPGMMPPGMMPPMMAQTPPFGIPGYGVPQQQTAMPPNAQVAVAGPQPGTGQPMIAQRPVSGPQYAGPQYAGQPPYGVVPPQPSAVNQAAFNPLAAMAFGPAMGMSGASETMTFTPAPKPAGGAVPVPVPDAAFAQTNPGSVASGGDEVFGASLSTNSELPEIDAF
ncbi:MAG: tetratricopeptide repeat protein [Planctomycetaceae bacterium]